MPPTTGKRSAGPALRPCGSSDGAGESGGVVADLGNRLQYVIQIDPIIPGHE
jgi:hypothetical protein